MLFIRIGVVTNSFGLDGIVKVTPITDNPSLLEELEFLMLAKDGKPCRSYKVLDMWEHNGSLLYTLEGVTTGVMAKQLSGLDVVVPETAIPETDEDEVYWFKIEGSKVVDSDGNHVGTLVDYIETGSTDIFRIELANGKFALISNNKTHVLDIRAKEKEVVINVEGLVDEDL